jgi:hypothetical protein
LLLHKINSFIGNQKKDEETIKEMLTLEQFAMVHKKSNELKFTYKKLEGSGDSYKVMISKDIT